MKSDTNQFLQHLVELSDHRGFDAKIESLDISIQSSPTRVWFWSEIMIKVIKLIVMEVYQFEDRVQPISIVFFGTFQLSQI